MPEEKKVQRANLWGDAISTWGKIIIYLVIFIVGVGTAYYKIETNSIDNVRQDDKFIELEHELTREFEIQQHRNQERYNRIMAEIKDLKAIIKENHLEIIDVQKKMSFMEGVQLNSN